MTSTAEPIAATPIAPPSLAPDTLVPCLAAAIDAADAADQLGLETHPLRSALGIGTRRVGFPGDVYVLALEGRGRPHREARTAQQGGCPPGQGGAAAIQTDEVPPGTIQCIQDGQGPRFGPGHDRLLAEVDEVAQHRGGRGSGARSLAEEREVAGKLVDRVKSGEGETGETGADDLRRA
jgi:hypothetical protein